LSLNETSEDQASGHEQECAHFHLNGES